MQLSSISLAITRLGGSPFTPAQLFQSSEVGGWYDASDFSVLFEDAAGTIPITAVEKPVGLWLDKSKGLVLGSELVTTTNMTAQNANGTVSVAGSTLVATCTVNGLYGARFNPVPGAVVGGSYIVTVTITTNSASKAILMDFGGYNSRSVTSTTGSQTFRLTGITGATLAVYVAGGVAGESFTVSLVSVRELPGNHAYQSTSANRPTLSARVNLLTYTEQFDNAVWAKYNATVVSNDVVAPDGTATGDRLTVTAGSASVNRSVVSVGVQHTALAYFKAGTNRYPALVIGNTSGNYAFAVFDVIGGTVTQSGSNGATIANTSIALSGDGWYRCSITFTLSGGATAFLKFELAPAGTGNSVDGNADIVGSTTNAYYYLWGADLRLTADASTAIPAYQRVTTSTDYDSVGFPMYLRGNGTSSTMATNSIDFTGTNKVTVFAGVTKLADAAQSVVTELSATIASNNGTFLLTAPNSAAANFNFSSKGTTQVDNTVITYTAPTTAVIAASADISAPSNSIKVNGAAATTVTGSQGTGNYGNFALNLFARSGGSLWLNGRLAQLIVRGAATSAAQISSTERWVAAKTGVVIS